MAAKEWPEESSAASLRALLSLSISTARCWLPSSAVSKMSPKSSNSTGKFSAVALPRTSRYKSASWSESTTTLLPALRRSLCRDTPMPPVLAPILRVRVVRSYLAVPASISMRVKSGSSSRSSCSMGE